MDILKVSCPNFGNLADAPSSVIVHYTAGFDAENTVRWLARSESRASYHWVISRSGRIWQLVDPNKAAFHAGVSEVMHKGSLVSGANRYTLSIAIANAGLLDLVKEEVSKRWFSGQAWRWRLPDSRGWYYPVHYPEPERATLGWDSSAVGRVSGWWEPYSDASIEALKLLLEEKCSGLKILGHEDIAVPLSRKTDPGPLFPWKLFDRNFKRTFSSVTV